MAVTSRTMPPRKTTTKSAAPSPAAAQGLADVPAPGACLLALEFRAFWEFGAVLPSWPVLQRAPKGDGHAVLVFPGLSANDSTTIPLRRYLDSLGYTTRGWEQGFNFGPRPGVLEAAVRMVQQACDISGKPVSLVGWSLGGIYARELAKLMPDMVRGVVTLGTPFAGSPRSTNAWRLYELTSGRDSHREAEQRDLPIAPPVPTTSIYSRTDGIVAWQGSLQAPSRTNPHTENVEVLASHFGIGLNPSAWWVVADRLAQQPGQWKPFERKPGRLHGLIFPDPQR
ncbi:MAG TPA: alpha/beta fold hydrolase [Burkholderiaceae bacterium]